MANAKAMAMRRKKAGIKHAIWSTFEDTREWVPLTDNRMPTLKEKYKVPHFDAKAEADHFFRELGVPTTFLLTSFYWDNFIYFGIGPKKGPDGNLAITIPMGDKKLPGIAAEDIGKCAYGIFKKGKEFIGKTVGISGEQLTGTQMAATFAKNSARSSLQRRTARCLPQFRISRRGRPRQHVPDQARLRKTLLRRAGASILRGR